MACKSVLAERVRAEGHPWIYRPAVLWCRHLIHWLCMGKGAIHLCRAYLLRKLRRDQKTHGQRFRSRSRL